MAFAVPPAYEALEGILASATLLIPVLCIGWKQQCSETCPQSEGKEQKRHGQLSRQQWLL
jgi:hypothetical protein